MDTLGRDREFMTHTGTKQGINRHTRKKQRGRKKFWSEKNAVGFTHTLGGNKE
jgi:hypothetical protein